MDCLLLQLVGRVEKPLYGLRLFLALGRAADLTCTGRAPLTHLCPLKQLLKGTIREGREQTALRLKTSHKGRTVLICCL